MKCQSLFSGKNIINILFAEFAHRVVKVKHIMEHSDIHDEANRD